MIYSIFIFLKIIAILLGITLSLLTYLTYRNKKQPFLLILAIGFSFITIATAIEEILIEFSYYSNETIHMIESFILMIGFVNIAYALFIN